ncbi:MAG: Asp-tRNA(Asn)/Glu-tRNA(Gln) amidotransferase subunit GatC [Pseudomonadales bacterium]|nr:Asp-tRNA(Asn)/Glu-tRNA(Gln) amidotransferase subunit GatC [Pseudomonadales bacterium]
MKINEEIVANIAELAQLDMPQEQLQEYLDSLNNVLELAEQMQSIDTTDVEPMSNPLDSIQHLHADSDDGFVTESNHRERYQKVAPETEQGLYLVPKVID